MWKKYRNKDGFSSIQSFKVNKIVKGILIHFKETPLIYLYKCADIGNKNYDELVNRAKKGRGLQRFIDNKCLDFIVMEDESTLEKSRKAPRK